MKKCLCLLLSLTMLCFCAGAALAETVALKVWGSQEDQELLAEVRKLMKEGKVAFLRDYVARKRKEGVFYGEER